MPPQTTKQKTSRTTLPSNVSSENQTFSQNTMTATTLANSVTEPLNHEFLTSAAKKAQRGMSHFEYERASRRPKSRDRKRRNGRPRKQA
jgi:hypothetical protein